MKRFFSSRILFASLLLVVSASLCMVSCYKEAEPSLCQIEVLDSAGRAVEGATVIVTGENSSAKIDGQTKIGDIRSEEVTGTDGTTTHRFKVPGKDKDFNLEAVLEVIVKKGIMRDTIKDTLYGRGSVHLLPGKTVKETVNIR